METIIKNFKWASNFEIPNNFGEFSGKRIDDVALSDRGLLWLDRLVGNNKLYGDLKDALEIYLNDSVIKKEIERLL